MPKFSYVGMSSKGKTVKGVINAGSEQAAIAQLPDTIVLTIQEEKTSEASAQQPKLGLRASFAALFEPKFSQKELQLFCQQMYTLLKAGLPIITAITKLIETTQNKQLVDALSLVLVALNQGRSLSFGMSQSPNIFSDFVVTLVKVGETSGKLYVVFHHLTEFLELEIDTKKKVTSAFRYPKMVIISILIALMIINAFVIPSFAQLFASFHGTLPMATRILMATSYVITTYWYLFIGITAFLIFAFRYSLQTPRGKIIWSQFKLKIPIIGGIVGRLTLSRFTKLFSILLEAGMTPYESIELVGRSTSDAFFSQKILEIADLISRGNTITAALQQINIFPPLVLQMISLGEDSGNLDTMLGEVTEFYQREAEYDIAHISEAIEPILLLVVGAMVLVLALGVFLPMWDMSSQMTNQH